MKRLIILIGLVLFAFVTMAQERTVTINMGEQTYYNYTGSAADTLTPTNQDTVDIVFIYKGPGYVKKIAVKTRFDKIVGADTTVSTSVFGKEFSDDATYVSVIAAATSSAVTTDNVVQVLTVDPYFTTAQYTSTDASHTNVGTAFTIKQDTVGFKYYPADSLKVPAITFTEAQHVITNAAQTMTPFDYSYRYYRVRYILVGNDSVGTGVLVDDVEIKLYVD